MLKLVIGSKIQVSGLPNKLFKTITDELTIRNPEYAKMVRLGLPTWRVKECINLYRYEQNVLTLPRGYITRLLDLAKDLQVKDIKDERIWRSPTDHITYDSTIQLRDYQKPAVDALLHASMGQGVLISPCGSGKTEMGCEIVSRLGQRTLWLTHRQDLLQQFFERAQNRLNLSGADIGQITGSTWKIGNKLTVGMIPTLANRDLSKIAPLFGCVIVDECHHCVQDEKALGQFLTVLSQLPAYYRIGLTASGQRADGLETSMFAILGPKVYEIPAAAVHAAGGTIIPTIRFIPTAFEHYQPETGAMFNYTKLVAAMTKDLQRNALISETINRTAAGHTSLVLGSSLEHLYQLRASVKGLKTAFIHGNTNKSERDIVLDMLRTGKLEVLFASYSLAKEGLDIPRLDQLYLVTPMKDQTSIQQAVGRIMRPAPGKFEATVYDFWDPAISLCQAHAKRRIYDVYLKLGCPIYGGPPIRQRKSKQQVTREFLSICDNAF